MVRPVIALGLLALAVACVESPDYQGPESAFAITTTLQAGDGSPLTCADVEGISLAARFEGRQDLEGLIEHDTDRWPCATPTFTTEDLPVGVYSAEVTLYGTGDRIVVSTCPQDFALGSEDFLLSVTFTVPPSGSCP